MIVPNLLVVLALHSPVELVKHELHQLPKDVAEAVMQDCTEQFPNSLFNQGWCADNEADVWLDAQKNGGGKMKREYGVPDLLIKPAREDR